MKYIFFFLLPLFCFSQDEELHYFIGKDSLVGVKNSKGEIIIPAKFDDARLLGLEDGQKIEENLILFIFHKDKKGNPQKSGGFMYDRKGNFLFHPFWFDNGPDYFSEGLMRFVGNNNKVGFADKNGNIVIEPKHDFVDFFQYGYADFCNGCRWEYASKDDYEHRVVVGGTWGKINKKGEIVKPSEKPKSPNDIEMGGVFYPNPFIYNENEQKIIDFFRKQEKELSILDYGKYSVVVNDSIRTLIFEIVDTPREHFPFYEIYTYKPYNYTLNGKPLSSINRREDFTFLVSEDGKKIYHYTSFGEKIEFHKWKKYRAELNSSKYKD